MKRAIVIIMLSFYCLYPCAGAERQRPVTKDCGCWMRVRGIMKYMSITSLGYNTCEHTKAAFA